MPDPRDLLLLLALPASGKSEIRRYLDHLPPSLLSRDFGMEPPVHLDDYPYVHMMRRIDEELTAAGRRPAFFSHTNGSFRYPGDWLTLIELLNGDFTALEGTAEPVAESPGAWILGRLERARDVAGVPPVDGDEVATAIDADAAPIVAARRERANGQADGTVVMEFARGGAEGAAMPLRAPFGYQHSLAALTPEILERAAILYVWVTPDESRRRNRERAHPGPAGNASILHHGVPEEVMRNDYGCDDMTWLLERSEVPGTVTVDTPERKFHLPAVTLDNRVDHTSFLRSDPGDWPPGAVAAFHEVLRETFHGLR